MNDHIERLVDDFADGRLTRRQLIAGLTGFLGVASIGTAQGDEPPRTFRATEINHIALNVTDVRRSRVFYERHLGMTLRSDNSPRSCFLNSGSDFLALFRDSEPGLDHYCYTVENYDAGEAVRRLKSAGLEPRRRDNRVYFDDPDGLEVQVSAPNSRRS